MMTLINPPTFLPHHADPFFCTGNKEEELDSDDLDDDSNEESDDEQEEGTSTGTETLNGLRRYMDQMDEELMGTKMGQSFTVKVNVFSLLSEPSEQLIILVYLFC